MVKRICKVCKKEFWAEMYRKTTANYCSYKCYWISKKGKKHSKEHREKIRQSMQGKKRGRIEKYKTKKGYIFIFKPEHPFCNTDGYIFEHRLVMEKYLGRYLTKEEIVHHNGTKYPMNSYKDRGDNRIENLKLFVNKSEHMKFHHPKGCQAHKKPHNITY